MARLFALIFMAGGCFAGTTNITVTPSTTFQKWHYWPCGGPNSPQAITNNSYWPSIRASALNSLVNSLGCNTLDFTVQSGTVEQTSDVFTQWIAGTLTKSQFDSYRYSPTNDNGNPDSFACDPAGSCPTAFPLDQVDYQIANFWNGDGGMRNLIQARGETPHIVLHFVHWPAGNSPTYLDTNPAEVGEWMLAVFRHMNSIYGYVPDVIDMQVEPDGHCSSTQAGMNPSYCANGSPYYTWSISNIAADLTAIRTRLSADGYTPTLMCCSTVNAAHGLGWYKGATAITGSGVIGILSTHLYGGYSYNQSVNSNFPAMVSQAEADGIPTMVSEYDIAGISDAMACMTQLNCSGFTKYGTINNLANVGASDFMKITSTSPYSATFVAGNENDSGAANEPAWYFAQIMPYVRDGCIREHATTGDSSWVVAFRCNGRDVVVERVTATVTQTINATGVAAGTYGCTYTYSDSILLQPCGANQTIGDNGTLTATLTGIPSATLGVTTAAVTFFGVAPAPGITSLNPGSATATGTAFTLTINGEGFLSGAMAQWDGSPLPTTFVTATQLTASVAASMIASAGNRTIVVLNPGGMSSNAVNFTTNASSQAITFAPLNNVTVATPALILNATASSGLPVSFSSTTTTVCTVSGSTVTILAAGTCSITASQAGNSSYSAAASVAESFRVTATSGGTPSEAGVFRDNFEWVLDASGNHQTGLLVYNNFVPPQAGDIPVVGDWSGSGTSKIGIYRPSSGTWFLDYNGNGVFDAGDKTYQFGGVAGDLPVVGDWSGSGFAKIGIFRSGFFWLLDYNGDGVFDAGDQAFPYGGVAGDVPVTGDWTGDGKAKVGVVRPFFPGTVPAFWILDANNDQVIDAGDQFFGFGGLPGDVAVVGDWNGGGTSKAGVYRNGFFWVVDFNGSAAAILGSSQLGAFGFGGIPGDVPVAGHWTP